jgi:hypothetical protein
MRFLLTIALLASLLAPLAISPAPAAAADCQFVLGFKALRGAIPAVVGECKQNEHFNAFNGDTLQETTKGLLVWRKADNFTAFTDGYRSWISGPYGVQVRLNSQRFAWEKDLQSLKVLKAGFGQSGTSVGYAILLSNPNETSLVEGASLDVTIYDAADKALGKQSGVIGFVLPAQKRALYGQIEVPAGTKITRVAASLKPGRIATAGRVGTLTAENVVYRGGSPAKATGVIVSPFDKAWTNVYVGAIAYNKAGDVIGGGGAALESVPANGRVAVEIKLTTSGEPASVEFYPSLTLSSKTQ